MDWSELKNWDEYTKLLVELLAITDPFSAIPIVLGLTKQLAIREKAKVIRSSTITFIIGLLIFTFIGPYILGFFGITIAALEIAGGIMFLFYGLELLDLIKLPSVLASPVEEKRTSLGIVPIGIPLLVGPGTASTVIIFAGLHESPVHKVLICMVIISVAALVYWVFRTSIQFQNRINNSTISIINKIMGVLLAAIAVEMILDGIAAHFPQIITIH